MGVLSGCRLGRGNGESAGHAEVEGKGTTAIQANLNLLPGTRDALDAGSAQEAVARPSLAMCNIGPRQAYPLDDAAHQPPMQTARNRLDFREFGHCGALYGGSGVLATGLTTRSTEA